MKKSILFLIVLHICILATAQEQYSHDYGKITGYELKMSEFENDKDAEAVVIYEYGHNFFQGDNDRGFLLHKKRNIKIKILKESGIKYAEFEIPYHVESNNWEEVSGIKATTYNLADGQVKKTDLDKKNIYEEQLRNNLRLKKFALPDVKVGSVIELEYTIITPYFENMGKWNFQKKIPVIYSKLKYNAIPYYEYTYLLTGVNKIDEYNSYVRTGDIYFGRLKYKEMIYEFGMKDIPAFKDEEFITSDNDYMISLSFQISKIYHPQGGSKSYVSTWPELCDNLLKDDDFGKYMKASEKEAKKILPGLNLSNKTTLEKTEIITQYVKSMYNWDRYYARYTSGKLSDFLKQKTGNVAEINLFLTGLLKAEKIDANPVLISTRKNGAIRKSHPFKHFFNYVITEVNIDGKKYFLDATVSLLSFNELPERCINVEGLVIKPKSEEWVETIQKTGELTEKNILIKPVPEQNYLEVNLENISHGYDAYLDRAMYIGSERSGIDKNENLIKHIKDIYNIDDPENLDVRNFEDIKMPFIYSFSCRSAMEKIPGKIFINPFCNLSIKENPFKQTKRTLPIDLVFIRSRKFKSSIEIPEGYKIEHLPEPKNYDTRLALVSYKIEQSADKIEVEAEYTLKQNVYEAKDYIQLKELFNAIIKQFSEMIILVEDKII